jgi:hypothetical protein
MILPSTSAFPKELDVEKLLRELTIEEKVAVTAGKCGAVLNAIWKQSKIELIICCRQRLLAHSPSPTVRHSLDSTLRWPERRTRHTIFRLRSLSVPTKWHSNRFYI